MYADNGNVLLEANRPNIERYKDVFQDFGEVSGLHRNWLDLKAILISNDLLAPKLNSLGWTWEEGPHYSKLLECFMGIGISHEQMHEKILWQLENGLKRSMANFSSLVARIVLINNLILNTLWYFLSLWAGDEKDLEAMEKIIIHFLWVGSIDNARHGVKMNTLLLHKLKGGLRVISLCDQVRALVAKIILWAISMGNHPFQILLQQNIKELKKMGNLGPVLDLWPLQNAPCHSLTSWSTSPSFGIRTKSSSALRSQN